MFDNVSNNLSVKGSRKKIPSAVGPNEKTFSKTASLLRKEKFIENFSRYFSLSLIISLIVLIVFVAAMYFVMISPVMKQMDLDKAEYSQKASLVSKYNNLGKQLDDIEAATENFDEMLPQKKDLSKVLVKLEKMAMKYELVFNSINNMSTDIMVKESEGEVVKKQKYEIVLSSGDYYTLKNYLKDIENNMRIMDIRSLVYSPDINMFFLNFEIYYLD